MEFQILLVVTVVRIAAPEGWAFIAARLEEIRRLGTEDIMDLGDQERREKRIAQQREQLHAAFDKSAENASWRKDSVHGLIGYLFPNWLEKPVVTPLDTPQSLAASEPTDYWQRILAEDTGDELHDQALLRVLTNWQKNETRQDLLKMLVDTRKAGAMLEQFGARLTLDQIYQLAGELIQLSLDRFGATAGFDSLVANSSVWRMAQGRRYKRASRFLVRQLRLAISKSVLLVVDLEYWWGGGGSRHPHPLRAKRIRKVIEILARSTLTSESAWVSSMAVSGGKSAYALFHLIRHGDAGAVARWRWCAPLILGAVNQNPQVVAPMLALLLLKEENVRHEFRTYPVDEDFLREFAPDAAVRHDLLRAAATETELAGLEPAVAYPVKRFRSSARALMAD